MKSHVTILGVIHIAFGAMGLLAGVIVFVAVFGGGLISGDRDAMFVTSIVGGSIAAFLCLLFVGGLGLKMWLKSYRESEGFRAMVAGKVAELLKSDVEMATFKWQDGSVYADGFRASGYEDATHSALELDGMRASFGGIADQAWQIPEVTVNRMNLEFSRNRLGGTWGENAAVNTSGAVSQPSVPGWLPSQCVDG